MPNYEEQTVVELRDELSRRDLSTVGNKAELVDRLAEDDRHDLPVSGTTKDELVERLVESDQDQEEDKHPGKIAIRAGGHIVYADPPPPTPEREPLCSVHGYDCPGHEENRGWQIEKKG